MHGSYNYEFIDKKLANEKEAQILSTDVANLSKNI